MAGGLARKDVFRALIIAAILLPKLAEAKPPGAGARVYSPDVAKGEVEIEARGARLAGGIEGGEGVYVYEAAIGVSDWWQSGAVIETENEPDGPVFVEAIEFENIFKLPRFPGVSVDFGVYAEYELNVEGEADAIELRWLAEYEKGPFNSKLNFNVERSFESGEAFEFGYGAISSVEVFGDVALGMEAFGEFGDAHDFGSLSRREHYAGPVALFEIEPEWLPGEVEVEAGYLFGVGAAEAEGQARLLIEWEFKI